MNEKNVSPGFNILQKMLSPVREFEVDVAAAAVAVASKTSEIETRKRKLHVTSFHRFYYTDQIKKFASCIILNWFHICA